MTADEVFAERLDAFLAGRGMTREMLLTTVDEPFGRPLLVVATGSILHGVGNQHSDLDVNVVVDREVSRLPIASYTHGCLIDTTYFGVSEVESWMSSVRDHPWPPTRFISREQWYQRVAELFNCTRFGNGLVLSARDGWSGWMSEFREPWLGAQVARWWRIESIRRQLGGLWLTDSKPLLAAQRLLGAVLAALESRAALAGQLYFAPKWLSEKLRILGDTKGLETMRALMKAPTTEREAQSHAAQCMAALEDIRGGHDHGLAAQLSYLSGVKVRKLDALTLVSRWNLRAIEISGAGSTVPEPPELLWEGGLDTRPPSDVLALFAGDMTWLSIVASPM